MEDTPRLRKRTLVRWVMTNRGVRKWVVLARRGEPYVPYRRSPTQASPTRNPSMEYRAAIVAYLVERDGLTCGDCGQPLNPSGRGVHIDHIVQVSRGGKHVLANFRLLHARCNRQRPRWD